MSRSSKTALHNPADSETRLPAWRNRLLEEQRFRLAQRTDLEAQIVASPALAHDEVIIGLRAVARAALVDIRAALERIDNGRYGCCARCERAIPDDRLEVLPTATLCMPCQQAKQQRGR